MAIAFFDVDKTLIQPNTAIAIVKYYLEKKYFGPKQIFWTIIYKFLYAFDLVEPEAMMQKGLDPFVGRVRSEVLAEIKEAYERFIKDAFYTEALELMKTHLEAGDRVLLLTSTSWDIAEHIAADLGIEYIATEAILDNGTYTNQMKKPIPYGEGKLVLAREYCAKHQEELKNAYFYTDSHSDLALLEKVGHPVCVNPDVRLTRKARSQKWKILHFSKITSCYRVDNEGSTRK